MEKEAKLDWGLIWFDDSDKTFNQKVLEVAMRYRQKYGRWPNLCYVNPSALNGGKGTIVAGDIRVVGLKTVLKNHFWIGVEKEKERDE